MPKVHVESKGGQSLPSDYVPELDEERSQFAICMDAIVLLSTAKMGDRDLTGRTLWTGIVLNEKEVGLLRRHSVNQEEELAAKLIARLPKKPRRRP